MKDTIKIILYTLVCIVFNFSCKNSAERNRIKRNDFEIKPEFKKYAHYIEDARFKVYLKMGAKKVEIKKTGMHADSMYLGEMNLALFNCEQKHNGIIIDFIFKYGDSSIYYDNSPLATGSVFYRNGNINDWFFAYGDLRMINFDSPDKIDTMLVLYRLNKRDFLNPWFKKRLEDSIKNRR